MTMDPTKQRYPLDFGHPEAAGGTAAQ